MTNPPVTGRKAAPSVSLSAVFNRTRRAAPAHLCPPRPQPTAPNGLIMSRDLSAFHSEFGQEFTALQERQAEQMAEIQRTFEGRLEAIVNQAAQKEHVANASRARLKDAIEGSRNDEEARMLRQENQRQHEMILELQRELARYRAASGGNVGWDKSKYFLSLGDFVQDAAQELQDIGEQLGSLAAQGGPDSSQLRAASSRMVNLGLDLGEFGENATEYGHEAMTLQQAAD